MSQCIDIDFSALWDIHPRVLNKIHFFSLSLVISRRRKRVRTRTRNECREFRAGPIPDLYRARLISPTGSNAIRFIRAPVRRGGDDTSRVLYFYGRILREVRRYKVCISRPTRLRAIAEKEIRVRARTPRARFPPPTSSSSSSFVPFYREYKSGIGVYNGGARDGTLKPR